MKKPGYLFLLGGVLSLLTVLFAAKDRHTFLTKAQQASHVKDYQSATQNIFESARYPSHVTLPVIWQ